MSRKRGRFERADSGTIFLDEIGELPPWAQVRLLRVLQTQEIERVGGSPPVKLDIRVIAATHRDLREMVEGGAFREDLWFRINAFPIHIPPLRSRKMDIPLLVAYFLKKKSKELGIHHIPDIAPGAVALLSEHTWPGNVRELENAVERALIQHRHGPLFFRHHHDIDIYEKKGFSLSLTGGRPPLTLDEMTRDYIREILGRSGGKINGTGGAAEILGVHPNTLRNRMNRLGIAYGRKENRTRSIR